MPGVDSPFAAIGAALPCALLASLLAYGPAPGLELIPYFLGLLAWMAMAVAAIAWAPIAALWRRVRGKRRSGDPSPASPPRDPVASSTPTAPGDGSPAST